MRVRARWGKMRGYYPISLLLTAEQYEGLRRLVERGKYKSLSEAVRAAVDEFLEREIGETRNEDEMS